MVLVGLFPQAYSVHAQEQNFRVVGTIVAGSSKVPLARAQVFIEGTNGLKFEAGILTDAQGRFGFDHVVPGKYLLSARARGYPQQTFQQHENFATGIAVGTGLNSENIVFGLFAGASIEGQVIDEFNEPIREAEVMLFREGINNGSESIRMQTQATTDDEGHYRFGQLQSGHYYVAVIAQPWYAQHTRVQSGQGPSNSAGGIRTLTEQNASLDVVYPITYYSGEINSAKASTITLQHGERANANFTLQPIPALHLRLTAPLMDLSQNVGVRISQPTFGGLEVPLPAQWTGVDKGFIDVGGIPPGHVILGLDAPLAQGSKEGLSWRQDIDAYTDATVSIPELTSTVTLNGTVKNTGTNGLPQAAEIEIRDQRSGATLSARITAKGTFEFQNPGVKPGKYDLAILNTPEFFVVHVSAIGAKVSGQSVEIGNEQPVQLTVEVATGMGRVDGVALRDGKPAGGIMILLVPQDFEGESPLLRRDQSDSDGTFTLIAVPGRYTLVAVDDGWDKEWATPSVLNMLLKKGEIVEVSPNGKYTTKVKVQ